ncbi:MAG: hypothetical protein ACKVS8_05110 [Phycisphaerales bacterium]
MGEQETGMLAGGETIREDRVVMQSESSWVARLVGTGVLVVLLVAVGLVVVPLAIVAVVVSVGYAAALFVGWFVRDRLERWGLVRPGLLRGEAPGEGREGVRVVGRAEG